MGGIRGYPGKLQTDQAGLLSSYLYGVAWEAKTRGWSSQTDMVTAGDPMPAAAFAALSTEAERAARGPLARYIALKARKLGLSEIASYDLAAPLVTDTLRFTIDQAKALTLAAVAPLGREYQQHLARGMALAAFADQGAGRVDRLWRARSAGVHPDRLFGKRCGPGAICP